MGNWKYGMNGSEAESERRARAKTKKRNRGIGFCFEESSLSEKVSVG